MGAFLGFIGALYIQSSADKRAKKNRENIILTNIRDELGDISSSLGEYLEKNIPLNYNIQTPNWNAVLYSGAILEFIENPLYTQTINAYSLIKRFNDMRNYLCKEDNLNEIKKIYNISKFSQNE